MNKTEARRYAKRLVAGYIEEKFHGSKVDPLVYDDWCESEYEGRRLSKEDLGRVAEEVNRIVDRLSGEGWYSEDEIRAGKWRLAKPHGKPGPRWRGYGAWLKRQGR